MMIYAFQIYRVHRGPKTLLITVNNWFINIKIAERSIQSERWYSKLAYFYWRNSRYPISQWDSKKISSSEEKLGLHNLSSKNNKEVNLLRLSITRTWSDCIILSAHLGKTDCRILLAPLFWVRDPYLPDGCLVGSLSLWMMSELKKWCRVWYTLAECWSSLLCLLFTQTSRPPP